jgi:hypothetical protein
MPNDYFKQMVLKKLYSPIFKVNGDGLPSKYWVSVLVSNNLVNSPGASDFILGVILESTEKGVNVLTNTRTKSIFIRLPLKSLCRFVQLFKRRVLFLKLYSSGKRVVLFPFYW